MAVKASLMRDAQEAILDAFDRADTLTAAQLQVATAGFSEITVKRGRAELVRECVLKRGKRGMEGAVMYTINRRQLAFSKYAQQPQEVPHNGLGAITYRNPAQRRFGAAAGSSAEQYDDVEDGYEDDDELDEDDDLHAAGSGWSWFVPIAICVGLGGIVLARRRFALFSIAGTNGMPLPPYTTRPAPRRYTTIAPYPGDDAIFGADETVDENPNLGVRLNAHERFTTFPNAYDFAPESDA